MTTDASTFGQFMRWSGFAVFAMVCVFGLVRFQNSNSRDSVHDALKAASSVPEQAAFFDQLAADFPDEYHAFLGDLAKLAIAHEAESTGYDASVQFTTDLRRANAHYLKSAPMASLRALNEAMLTALEGLKDDPELCARYAIMGGSGLTMQEALALDLGKQSRASAATFAAIAAGRDTPVAHPSTSDADILSTLMMWQTQPDVSPDMMTALSSGDPKYPNQCAAQLSFQRFVIDSRDPVVERAMLRLVVLANQV